MTDDEDRLTRRYRELAREEPPAAVDASILAASRRAVKSRPASQRWAAPVSIAAVLVLAVGVALNMQHEQPGIETSEPAARIVIPAPPGKDKADAPPAADALSNTTPAASPAQSREAPAPRQPPEKLLRKESAPRAAPQAELRERATQQHAAPPAAPPPPPEAPQRPAAVPSAAPLGAPATPMRSDAEANRAEPKPFADSNLRAAPAAAAPPAAAAMPRAKTEMSDTFAPQAQKSGRIAPSADPTAELERIARLRSDGLHNEADKALEEFRRRFPDYRIPDPVWERVKPR